MTWDRPASLANCAYRMIAHGNQWGGFIPEKVIETYMGPNSGFTVKRFREIWNEQLDRFEREQLTKAMNAPVPDIGDGK